MSNKALSIVVTKKDLDCVVGRASLAAMTEEGQSEISKASNETKGCVRISAFDGKIVFESSVSRFSSRYVIKTVDNSDGAEIISDGETCVPAKELRSVAGKIKSDRKVSILFIPSTATSNASTVAKAVLPDGVVEIGSISGSKVVSKTKIEAYPSAYFSAPDYPDESLVKVVTEGKAGVLKKTLGTIGFAVNPSDLKEIFDKFAVFSAPDGIYFVSSDGRRCAVVKLTGDVFVKFMNVETETPILADSEFLSASLSSIGDDDPLVFGIDNEEKKIYLYSGNTSYCINMLDSELRKTYPNYKKITETHTKAVFLINRDEFAETMDLLGVVNNDRGVYTFCKDEQVVKLVGRGIGTVKETTGNVFYKQVEGNDINSPSISLNTKYLSEGIKKMSCENIRMSFSDNERIVKIEDEENPKFVYFMQVMNPNEA